MTSPPAEPSAQALGESLAALAVQVAVLRGQIAQINRRLDQAGLRGDLDLAARFEELAQTVADALDAAAPRGPAAPSWISMVNGTPHSSLAIGSTSARRSRAWSASNPFWKATTSLGGWKETWRPLKSGANRAGLRWKSACESAPLDGRSNPVASCEANNAPRCSAMAASAIFMANSGSTP